MQRTPHPEDRRAKLVQLTAAGRAAAARADAILDEPPAALHDVPAEDLEALLRVLGAPRPLRAVERRGAQTPSAGGVSTHHPHGVTPGGSPPQGEAASPGLPRGSVRQLADRVTKGA